MGVGDEWAPLLDLRKNYDMSSVRASLNKLHHRHATRLNTGSQSNVRNAVMIMTFCNTHNYYRLRLRVGIQIYFSRIFKQTYPSKI